MEAWGSMLMRSDLYIYICIRVLERNWSVSNGVPRIHIYIYTDGSFWGLLYIILFLLGRRGVTCWPRRSKPQVSPNTRRIEPNSIPLFLSLSLSFFYCYDFHLFPPFSSSSLCASISFTTTCSSGKERRRDLFDTSLVSLWDSVCTHFHRGSLIAIDIYIFFSRLYRLVFPAQKREIGDD